MPIKIGTNSSSGVEISNGIRRARVVVGKEDITIVMRCLPLLQTMITGMIGVIAAMIEIVGTTEIEIVTVIGEIEIVIVIVIAIVIGEIETAIGATGMTVGGMKAGEMTAREMTAGRMTDEETEMTSLQSPQGNGQLRNHQRERGHRRSLSQMHLLHPRERHHQHQLHLSRLHRSARWRS